MLAMTRREQLEPFHPVIRSYQLLSLQIYAGQFVFRITKEKENVSR